MKNEEKTKICKHCKEEINFKAKVCPHCRKKQGNPIIGFFFIIIFVIIIIAAVNGGNEDNTENTSKQVSSSATEQKEQEVIEYTSISVADLDTVLKDNALKAKETYKGAYLEITGKLSNIDASGKYISLSNDDYIDVYGVQCYIKGDEQKQKVMDMTVEEHYTIRVKIKDVGEVLGYTADIIEFVE